MRLSGIFETEIMEEIHILRMRMCGMTRMLLTYVNWRTR